MTQVFPLNPGDYQPHRIHTQERNWAETNCYVDVWIELLHGWGFEPIAALPFTVGIDFEGDQWTFFKFPLVDLLELYGLDVQELAIWRPLSAHLEEQISRGRPVLVELDSYFLPDTAGTAYKLEHVKSSVAAIEIDIAGQHLGYFHGQGYYHVEGEDFLQVMRLKGCDSPEVLPPYCEFVKRRDQAPQTRENLVQTSVGLLRRQLGLLPDANPFEKFRPRLSADLDWLTNAPLEAFHKYSFATLRQFGACYELAATYLQWLGAHDVSGLEAATVAFSNLSTGAKTLQFNLARAMSRKKPLNLAAIDDMAGQWQSAIDSLKAQLL